jgi:hypothetical protein
LTRRPSWQQTKSPEPKARTFLHEIEVRSTD